MLLSLSSFRFAPRNTTRSYLAQTVLLAAGHHSKPPFSRLSQNSLRPEQIRVTRGAI
jgi:hypothetical protein